MGRTPVTIDPVLAKEAARLRRRYERLGANMDEVRRDRADLIRRMRKAGYGYDTIASVIGVTKARVAQIDQEGGRK